MWARVRNTSTVGSQHPEAPTCQDRGHASFTEWAQHVAAALTRCLTEPDKQCYYDCHSA